MTQLVAMTTRAQLEIIRPHILRLIEKRDRYEGNTLAWAYANIEVRLWQQMDEILYANLNGKTVQPS